MERWKIIPSVASGPWAVKAAVGQKPALLAKKLTQRYYRGPQYMEVDCDVASSKTATVLSQMLIDKAGSFEMNLAFTLEGRTAAELPERMLGAVRLSSINVTRSPKTPAVWRRA